MKKITMTFPELPYAVEEALNRLRINIKFCGKNTRKILVVSTLEDEGKSFVSTQLWKLLAEAGLSCVLVDVDMRKSVMAQVHGFNCDEEIRGIDFYLSGLAEYGDVVYHTNVEGGDIIPCTNALENPSALFEDPRFGELLGQLEKDYRYVILDAPPLFAVADGMQIASLCDGAVLVVESARTPRKLIRQSLHQLERAECRLLGIVLNKAKGSRYGRRYASHYDKDSGKNG